MEKFETFFEETIRPRQWFISSFVHEYNKLKQYEPHLEPNDKQLSNQIYIEEGIWFQIYLHLSNFTIRYWLTSNMDRIHEFYYAVTDNSDYIGRYRNALAYLNIKGTMSRDDLTIEEFAGKIYDEYTSIGYLF